MQTQEVLAAAHRDWLFAHWHGERIGQIAVVTGASAGIGRATASLLAEHGMGVVLTYRDREADAAVQVEQARRVER